ncbi:Ig-like domain-containing protein [Mesobacillus sp. S13]|uniref:Ig-like domain-containing protein n=1 Tax=Mesobacillus sp. S13 TaxID=2880221 RepID=UPI001CF1494A|nr:Ig-like domain-containing protein [Mesobacillus sp. S13]
MKKFFAGVGFLVVLFLGLQQVSAETVPGNITADTTWTKEGSPYRVGIITIDPGVTLTVEPGVEIINSGSPSWIDVKGKLNVKGTSDEKVIIKDVLLKGFDFTGSSINIEHAIISRTNRGFLITSMYREVILRNNEFSGGDISIGSPTTSILIENNLFQDNAWLDLNNGLANILVQRNTFFNKEDYYPSIRMSCSDPNCKTPNITISENNFFGFPTFFVEVEKGRGLIYNGANNYWSTTDTAQMKRRILDGARDDRLSSAILGFSPIAYKPINNGLPFGNLEAPAVHQVGDGETIVTGLTDGDSTVKVLKEDVLIGEGQSNTEGAFSVSIPPQNGGRVLTVTSVDSYGRISPETTLTVSDTSAPEPPQVNKVNDQATKVEGSTEAGATVIVKVAGAEKRTTADHNGYFSVEINPQKAGTVIEVQAIDTAGNLSGITKVTVVDEQAPARPVVTSGELTDQSTSLQGTAEPHSKVKLLQDDQVIFSAFADSTGNFSITFSNRFKGDSVIKIVAEDLAGNVSEPLIITVKDVTAPYVDINRWEYVNEKSSEVKGFAEPGAFVEILKNDTVIGSGTALADGTFTISIPVQPGGTELVIRATDKAGNSGSVKVNVIDLPDPLPLTVEPINTLSNILKGKTAPNVFVNIEIDGVLHVVQADGNGYFELKISPLKEGTLVSFLANNDEGHYSEEVVVPVSWKAPSGWYKAADGFWYYYDPATGSLKTGWLKWNKKWYYLEADGKMKVGWKQLGSTWYYLNSDGTMRVGWLSYGGKWYYFPSSGAMQTGLGALGGKWYYFNSSGAMLTGWQKINQKWYYFNSGGAGQIGWAKLSGKWYYFNTSAIMQTGWQKIGGKWYYFNSGGAMVTGWNTIGNKRYYFNSSGVWLY